MVYFYCCDVTVRGEKKRTNGYTVTNRKIKTGEEVEKVMEELTKKVKEGLCKDFPDLAFEEMEVLLTAFNPL